MQQLHGPGTNKAMKNKHLLLIFFCTLLVGLLVKYLPWNKGEVFHTDLMRIEAAQVQRIAINRFGKSELLLECNDEGWVASQDDFAIRTVETAVAPMLAVLAGIRSRRIVPTAQPDTLSLGAHQAIQVAVLLKNGRTDLLEIGLETLEDHQPVTYIKLEKHGGIYLVSGHLRRMFDRSVDDFRSKTVCSFTPKNLLKASVFRPGKDTVCFQQRDTSTWWELNHAGVFIAPKKLEEWLNQLQKLNGLPFASHHEEAYAAENPVGVVVLNLQNEDTPLRLQFFEVVTTNNGGFSVRKRKPLFLVQSSQNVYNFFALSDTLLAQGILAGPFTVPD